MDTAPAHIVIQIDPGAVPISGHISAGGENSQPFTGWTGLFALLRAAAIGGVAPNSEPGGQGQPVDPWSGRER